MKGSVSHIWLVKIVVICQRCSVVDTRRPSKKVYVDISICS